MMLARRGLRQAMGADVVMKILLRISAGSLSGGISGAVFGALLLGLFH